LVHPKIPDFTDPRWQESRSDAELVHSILEGKGKAMRPVKALLGPIDARQMVAFIRAFRGGQQIVPEESEPDPVAASPAPPAGNPAPPETPRPAAPPRGNREDPAMGEGAWLFQRACVRCHGADGRGAATRVSLPAIPDFTDPGWQARRSDPQLIASILEGKGAQMPSFRERLGGAEVRALVARIRAFRPGWTSGVGASPGEFESRFRQLEQQWEGLERQLRAIEQPGEGQERPLRARSSRGHSRRSVERGGPDAPGGESRKL
jgi:mono/diheme cytochrome c family protein